MSKRLLDSKRALFWFIATIIGALSVPFPVGWRENASILFLFLWIVGLLFVGPAVEEGADAVGGE